MITGHDAFSYLERIPSDPKHDEGARYYYVSNGRRFQIYASLEGRDEDEFSEAILARNLPCGKEICNFGLAYGKTPLDKSLEEYENELRNLEKTKYYKYIGIYDNSFRSDNYQIVASSSSQTSVNYSLYKRK